MHRDIAITTVAALSIGLASGYWLGRGQSPTPGPADTSTAVVDHPAPTPSNWPAGWGKPEQLLEPDKAIGSDDANALADEEGRDDPHALYAVRQRALATVDQLALALSADEHSPEDIQRLKQALLDQASTDSLALQGLVERFSADPSSPLGGHLGDLLAEIRDPEVEAMAQQMARSGNEDQMIAGLAVLGGLGIPSESTLALTRQIIDQPYATPDTLMSAMYAMPVMQTAPSEARAVIDSLTQLTHHPDEGVRSNSLFKIAEWARDAEDLRPVVQALDSQRATDDRISAAMAIAQSNVVDDSLRGTLLDRMGDSEELWEVRRYAAVALERFRLSSDEYRQLEAFRETQLDLQNNG